MEFIPIDRIVLDPDVQMRVRGLTQTVVDEYARKMSEGDEFPPADAFYDGEVYRVADGFHRIVAAKKNGAAVVACNVHVGDKRAAILFAVGANAKHGLKRTNVDKRRSVECLLKDAEWSQCSDHWIAQQAGVTHTTIPKVRKYLGIARPPNAVRKTKDGRKYATGRLPGIGYGERTIREENIHQLLALMDNRFNVTLTDASNALETYPQRVLLFAEAAAKRGKPVTFAPDRSERLEHQLKSQVRDANAGKTRLLEELKTMEAKLETMMELRGVAPLPPIVAKKGVGDGKRLQGVPVMMLSDLHVEERVTLEQTGGLNEYNLEIAEECLDRCADAFEWFEKDVRWDFREAIIALLGDTFSGYIHAELAESNFLSPVQAVKWLLERLEKMIRKILATTRFQRIRVVCKDGNHGRLTQKMRCSTRTENSLEWLMYHELAVRFRDEPRIAFTIEDSLYTYVDVFDQTLAFTHFDQFQYMGGVGGLLIPVRRGLNEVRKMRSGKGGNPICFCGGHFHTRLDDGDIVVNGSAIGPTSYSISKSMKPERRAQHFFIVDSVHGKLAPTAPIWLPYTGQIPEDVAIREFEERETHE